MLQFILSLNCKALKKSQASQVNLQGDSVFNSTEKVIKVCLQAYRPIGSTERWASPKNSYSPELLETPTVTSAPLWCLGPRIFFSSKQVSLCPPHLRYRELSWNR